jgi:hypothetical protein
MSQKKEKNENILLHLKVAGNVMLKMHKGLHKHNKNRMTRNELMSSIFYMKNANLVRSK